MLQRQKNVNFMRFIKFKSFFNKKRTLFLTLIKDGRKFEIFKQKITDCYIAFKFR